MSPPRLCRAQDHEELAGADENRSGRHILRVGIQYSTMKIPGNGRRMARRSISRDGLDVALISRRKKEAHILREPIQSSCLSLPCFSVL